LCTSARRRCGDEDATVAGESLTGERGQRLDELQVILRRDDGDVSHVGRQQRQLGIDIGAGAVPSQQRLDRKGVTVMPMSA
jgi:hypothetical protein